MKRHNPKKINQLLILERNIRREAATRMLTVILDPEFDQQPEEKEESYNERFQVNMAKYKEEFSGYIQRNIVVHRRYLRLKKKLG